MFCKVNVSRNKLGWNPLLQVSKKGDISMLKQLLEAEADISITNNIGENCLDIS